MYSKNRKLALFASLVTVSVVGFAQDAEYQVSLSDAKPVVWTGKAPFETKLDGASLRLIPLGHAGKKEKVGTSLGVIKDYTPLSAGDIETSRSVVVLSKACELEAGAVCQGVLNGHTVYSVKRLR